MSDDGEMEFVGGQIPADDHDRLESYKDERDISKSEALRRAVHNGMDVIELQHENETVHDRMAQLERIAGVSEAMPVDVENRVGRLERELGVSDDVPITESPREALKQFYRDQALNGKAAIVCLGGALGSSLVFGTFLIVLFALSEFSNMTTGFIPDLISFGMVASGLCLLAFVGTLFVVGLLSAGKRVLSAGKQAVAGESVRG